MFAYKFNKLLFISPEIVLVLQTEYVTTDIFRIRATPQYCSDSAPLQTLATFMVRQCALCQQVLLQALQ